MRRRGRPATPRELRAHDCIVVRADLGGAAWPFRGERGGAQTVAIEGRIRCNSHTVARSAALAGLGIAIFPEFACATDIRRRRLVPVLDDWRVEVGEIALVHPAQRFTSVATERFVALALARLSHAPWR